jgi:hypothetical protein
MALPFDETNPVRKTYFINASEKATDATDDAGKVPQLESDGLLSPRFTKFSGAKITGTQQIDQSVQTQLNFSVEAFDSDNFADLGTNDSIFTIPRDGYYKIQLNAYIASPAAAFTSLVIRLNNSTTLAIASTGDNSSSGQRYPGGSVSTIVFLEKDDVIDFTGSSNTSTPTWTIEAIIESLGA